MIRTYSQLKQLETIEERFDYLNLVGTVGNTTFGGDRYLNQIFYKSQRWLDARNEVIYRDHGCDLGIEGYELQTGLLVHHMNPITIEDLESNNPDLYDPEFLITSSKNTHNGIHYGDKSQLPDVPIARTRNDTCPWRK